MSIAENCNEFDYSRFKCFQTCPRKHAYIYKEQIRCEENEFTTPGKLFHKIIELTLTKPINKKEIADTYGKFNDMCINGELPYEPGTLSYVVQKYFEYYKNDFAKENTLLCEYSFEDDIDGTDKVVGTIDQVYERDGLYILRDIKTRTAGKKLKYTYDDVKFNQQLLFYVPFAERKLEVPIDAVEIDEVRIAHLRPVPLLKNGKPSKDKRELELVTLEAYEHEIRSQGLPLSEYSAVLDWLRERGHPLFRRTQAQLLTHETVETNMQDMLHTYQLIKSSEKHGYRNINPLCNYCVYSELCELDRYNPAESDRKIYIEKITQNS